MKYLKFFARAALGLTFSAAAIAACGDSTNGDTATGASGNDGSGAPGAAGNPGSQGASGNGTGSNNEGNPNVVMLGPNADPTVPVNLIAGGAVECGDDGSYCLAPNLTCCIGGGAFSCAPQASECPDDTVATVACSSSASCASGQVCCSAGGGPGGGPDSTSCETSCPDGSDQLCVEDDECLDGAVCDDGECAPPACTATSCGSGELCCRGLGGPGAAPACAAPGADGLCAANRRQVCEDDAQCPEGNTCDPLFGGGGGGFTVCTPPPCTPGACAAGQACCVGGGLGGTPICAVATDTGTCQGNSRLACVTDAECAPTPGTQCLPPPNGMGALSCRVPPPAPAADAGADGG